MGGYPSHGTGPGGFPRPGDAANDGSDATAEVVCKVVVQLGGSGKRVGGGLYNGNLHLAKAKYGRALYCNVTDSRPLRGGKEKSGGTGRDTFVGTGRT